MAGSKIPPGARPTAFLVAPHSLLKYIRVGRPFQIMSRGSGILPDWIAVIVCLPEGRGTRAAGVGERRVCLQTHGHPAQPLSFLVRHFIRRSFSEGGSLGDGGPSIRSIIAWVGHPARLRCRCRCLLEGPRRVAESLIPPGARPTAFLVAPHSLLKYIRVGRASCSTP